MESVAQLGAATVGLVEAELRSLRRGVMRLLAAAGIGVAILVLALTSLGFLLTALFLALDRAMPAAGSAATIAALTLLIALVGLLVIGRMLKGRISANGDVAAARAQVRQVIEQLDAFAAIRRRPWLSIAIAAAIGAMLAASTESLVGAAALLKALNGLLRSAAFELGKVMGETPREPAPAQEPRS